MGIFVNQFGDIVTTAPNETGVKLIAYGDEMPREQAERVAARLRALLDVTDTVWYVTHDTHRVSPVMDNESDTHTWLIRNQHRSIDYAIQHGGYGIAEVPGNAIDRATETAAK